MVIMIVSVVVGFFTAALGKREFNCQGLIRLGKKIWSMILRGRSTAGEAALLQHRWASQDTTENKAVDDLSIGLADAKHEDIDQVDMVQCDLSA
jgi:hypothetical protein